MARLERASDRIVERLNGIDSRLATIEVRLEQLFDRTDRKFLWVMGLVLVSILLSLIQRFVPNG